MPALFIAKPLLPFMEKKKRYKVALGGRGGSKSIAFADLCLMDAQMHGIKTLCCREYQNTIEDSVHSLLKRRISHLGLQGFDVKDKYITYNGKVVFKFRGLARNPEGVQSYDDFQRVWIEEAQTISYRSLRALEPTLRSIGSEIWISGNPRSMASPFCQNFLKPFEKELRRDGYYEDDDHLIVWINVEDNPFLKEDEHGNPLGLDEEGKQIIHPLLRQREIHRKKMSKAEFDHTWKGETYDEVEGSIIPVEWFDAAIDAHKKLGFEPSGSKFVAFDPFNGGADAHGYAYRHGSVYLDICDNPEGDANSGMAWAANRAMSVQADHFRYDATGAMGLKLQVDDLFKHNKVKYHLFNGGETPDDPALIYEPVDDESIGNRKSNKDTFINKRAQGYFRLADRFLRTYQAVTRFDEGLPPISVDPEKMISLSSDIKALDALRAEICRIPQKINPNGKKQILSKPEMAKKPYELPSPNMADCMMMNEFVPEVVLPIKPMFFHGG